MADAPFVSHLMPTAPAADDMLLPASPAVAKPAQAEDMQLIREAAKLTRELSTASPAIYWIDFLASALLGYVAFALAILAVPVLTKIIAGLVAILALYRASSFIHEITHMKRDAVPGFRTAWNLLIGIPMLIPSFLYEGTHNQHHNKTRYGTADDPEYLPLAHMKPYSLALFLIVAALGPIGFLIRFAVLTPLSAIIPWVRRETVARFSTLAINPEYRRAMPSGDFARDWRIMEAAASLWAIGLLTATFTGHIAQATFLTGLLLVSGALVINQVRTLVAHLWDNDGDVISVTQQYLDSVNVPPPGLLPEIWAPVGLRYHALHHLLPSVPYHALPEAHRRLMALLPPDSSYQKGNHAGLFPLVSRLASATMRRHGNAA
jgi:fatty acid desaturase